MKVLDASALLAVLFEEPGADRVAPIVRGGLMSTVNLAEVLTRLVRDGRPLDEVLPRLNGMGLRWAPFDADQARVSVELVTATSRFGFSLGDRVCLALALLRGIPAVTADRDWARLDLGIPIEVIR